jgi:Uma2 family endonuclease
MRKRSLDLTPQVAQLIGKGRRQGVRDRDRDRAPGRLREHGVGPCDSLLLVSHEPPVREQAARSGNLHDRGPSDVSLTLPFMAVELGVFVRRHLGVVQVMTNPQSSIFRAGVMLIVRRTGGDSRRMVRMRAVVVHLTAEELAYRRSRGLDRWDEMWEGVLHMTPAPTVEHQRIVDALIIFLAPHLTTTARGTLRSSINVFRETTQKAEYRIPDLTFVASGRAHVLHEDGVRSGGPDAVIEIRSPEDETYDKLPFYAALGVREVIVIDRDSKRPEIYRLAGSQYVALQQDPDGWLRSETMMVRFRGVFVIPPRLAIEDVTDVSARAEI